MEQAGREGELDTRTISGSEEFDIEHIFLANRRALLTFLARLGAGDAAEDILHEMWLRLPRTEGTITTPISYLYRMANSVLIDWERSRRQAVKRDAAWGELAGPLDIAHSDQPGADRVLESRQLAERALAVIATLDDRVARVFTRHRLDGLTQREVAAELGVSVGTVEGDLRRAYKAIIAMRESHDKA